MAAQDRSKGKRLEAGAEVAVVRRSDHRKRRDPGHLNRTGIVTRIFYDAGGETKAFVRLHGTMLHDESREWLWATELQVIKAAQRARAPGREEMLERRPSGGMGEAI